MVWTIRYRHLKQLVQTAAALPGRKLEVALWNRLEPWSAGLPPKDGAGAPDPSADAALESPPPAELPEATRDQIQRLRAVVGTTLRRLARQTEEALAPALVRAQQSWDRSDDLTIIDAPLASALAEARRELQAAAAGADPTAAAVALEGLLAVEAGSGLAALAEQRLPALIRLRVRARGELLPGGRPFLDLGAALNEAAQAWG
jgi:hypothetical protein